MINIISNIEDFESLSTDWSRIFERSDDVTPFQDFKYIKLSIKYLLSEESKLHIIVVRYDGNGKVIALFPTIIDKYGCLRFINDYHTDFCSAIIDPDYQNYNLFEDVANYIISEPLIKSVNFTNLKADNCLLSVFKPFIRTCHVTDCSYYSCQPIAKNSDDKDFVDAFKYIPGRRKKKLRKSISEVSDSDIKIYRKETGDEYPEDDIISLTESMIAQGKRTREYFTPEMLSFWKEQYNHNILIASVLKKGDKPLSCNFLYYDKKHDEYIKWIMIYDENKWNLTNSLGLARAIYKNGGGCINFARGIYDYKMDNFHPDVKALFQFQIVKTEKEYIHITGGSLINYYKRIIRHRIGVILRQYFHIIK